LQNKHRDDGRNSHFRTKEKIDPTYKRLRWQVFIGIFIGYAGYYLVRKNFSLAMPYLSKKNLSLSLLQRFRRTLF